MSPPRPISTTTGRARISGSSSGESGAVCSARRSSIELPSKVLGACSLEQGRQRLVGESDFALLVGQRHAFGQAIEDLVGLALAEAFQGFIQPADRGRCRLLLWRCSTSRFQPAAPTAAF